VKHAIIETGGKQYRVAEGDVIFIEKLNAEAGEAVKFDRVLAVIDEAGSVFGKPVTACGSVAEGVRTAIAQAEQGEAIVAFGSLYMVGDIRQTAME
jgi:ribosomal protein L21